MPRFPRFVLFLIDWTPEPFLSVKLAPCINLFISRWGTYDKLLVPLMDDFF